jgi:hypothetical protein
MIAGCSKGTGESHLTKPSSVWVHALNKLLDPATPPTPPIPPQAGPCNLNMRSAAARNVAPKPLLARLNGYNHGPCAGSRHDAAQRAGY